LHDPTRETLLAALTGTGQRAREARAGAARVEVIVYFSGHADDQGLMLGRELLPYRELRASVAALGADVGITILDACASGAITRLKGGQVHPGFLGGIGHEAQGYAFLTSSSENEAAQESERLGGSFFTHALVTGLRGAADVTGDGRVTLNEAYQFAFHETLAETTPTEGGAQHPSYDIKMAGTGDVVMTDVRQTSSSLVLGEEYDGRFYVLNEKRQLVAELYKPYGRRVELGLDAGTYDVFLEQPAQRLTSSLTLVDGQKRELARSELRQTRLLPTRRRGGEEPGKGDLLDGRLRLQTEFSTRRAGGHFAFLHWVRPTLAFQAGFGAATFGGDTDVWAGVRYYAPVSGPIRPWVGAALGRFMVPEAVGGQPDVYGFQDRGRFGGMLGAGADLYVGRRFTVTADLRSVAAGGRWRIDPYFGFGVSVGGKARK
ncbi:MAG: caspase family protein, partial [bacterium]